MKTNFSAVRGAGVCLLAAFLALTACDKQESNPLAPQAEASLRITVAGQPVPGGRAVAPSDGPGQEALEAAENTLKNMTVFVFNTNGTLDKQQTFDTPTLTETITGLVAGQKKVVVAANVPASVVFPDGISYAWFADAAHVIDLDTQTAAADGLFMSGEATVTLTANQTAAVTIPVSRLVAKVRLGTFALTPDPGHDADKFVLKRVAIMKARGSATMGIPEVTYTPDRFYGGLTGDKSVEKAYLAETVSASDHTGRYFYVLPNDNEGGNATLLTLEGTYDGQTVYFPFRINDKAGSGGATTDGTFLLRNHAYVVNVTLRRPGSGTTDPEVPSDPATLTVTVEPQPWATELIQNVEW